MKKFKRIARRAVSAAAALCMTAISFSAMPGVTADAADIYGDVNRDGVVDIGDVISLSKYLNGMVPTSSISVKYSDVDQNAIIDVNDSKTIMNRLIGLVATLPYSEAGSQFSFSEYTLPADESREYIKYDCSTKKTSRYTLTVASPVSATSGDWDDREIDSSDNAQCIVRLEYKKGNGGEGRGTGFIVSNHVIATAAHCVYAYDYSAFFTNYTVKIYDAAGTSVIKEFSASEIHAPTAYVESSSNVLHEDNFDYALIYIEEDLSAYGNMALGIASNQFSGTEQTVTISGFPGEIKPDAVNEEMTDYRYYGVGNISPQIPKDVIYNTSAVPYYRLFTTAYASGGDSGGPMYIEYTLNGSTFRSAIGILVRNHDTGSLRGTIRITLPLLRFYNNNPNIG